MKTASHSVLDGRPGESVLLPVIHHRDNETTLANAEIAVSAGCRGVFLIQMDGKDHLVDEAIPLVRSRFPNLGIGVNRLLTSPAESILRNVELGADFTWSDTCGVSSRGVTDEAVEIQRVVTSNPAHRFFGSVAFKYQGTELNPPLAASLAFQTGFIPTTSGSATGWAPSIEKIEAMAKALPEKALAVASGITPENVTSFIPHVRFFLVATGISKTFHEFDAELVHDIARKIGETAQPQ